MQEQHKRFYLKMYVTNSEGKVNTQRHYSDSLMEIDQVITSKLGIITDYDDKEGKGYANTLAHHLNKPGDGFYISKNITYLNLHIAKIDFRVIYLED